MISEWSYSYIGLETEQYRMEQKSVFDDRLPSGWMLFLPKIIKSSEVPSAFSVINLPDNKSTLIVVKNKFDGKDIKDITCANEVEMELAASGYLPRWLDL
ncbi:MAG: hypothetical protein XXXJIFNMEKO3_02654 [Candidatus Erwinia impunctatus]|nr:hypothetical protein XXXJIFNMEKO_02654 [Culicoides impunctatus]